MDMKVRRYWCEAGTKSLHEEFQSSLNLAGKKTNQGTQRSLQEDFLSPFVSIKWVTYASAYLQHLRQPLQGVMPTQ